MTHAKMQVIACKAIQVAALLLAIPVTPGLQAADSEVITITAPKSGMDFTVGDSMSIEWTVAEGTFLSGVVIEISADDGLNFVPIVSLNRRVRCFTWHVDSSIVSEEIGMVSLLSDECVIRVRDYENTNLASHIGPVSIAYADGNAECKGSPRARRVSGKVLTHCVRIHKNGVDSRVEGMWRIDGRPSGSNAARRNGTTAIYLRSADSP